MRDRLFRRAPSPSGQGGQPVGIGIARRAEHRRRRLVSHHPPVGHHRDPVGDDHYGAQIAGVDQTGRPRTRPTLAPPREDPVGRHRRQPTGPSPRSARGPISTLIVTVIADRPPAHGSASGSTPRGRGTAPAPDPSRRDRRRPPSPAPPPGGRPRSPRRWRGLLRVPRSSGSACRARGGPCPARPGRAPVRGCRPPARSCHGGDPGRAARDRKEPAVTPKAEPGARRDAPHHGCRRRGFHRRGFHRRNRMSAIGFSPMPRAAGIGHEARDDRPRRGQAGGDGGQQPGVARPLADGRAEVVPSHQRSPEATPKGHERPIAMPAPQAPAAARKTTCRRLDKTTIARNPRLDAGRSRP